MFNKKGSILALDDFCSLLVNIYNAKRKKEHISVLNDPTTKLTNSENIDNHNIIFTGNFNIFIDALPDGSSALKSWSINKLIKLKEMWDVCDIWRLKNPKKVKYTFWLKKIIWNY